MTLRIAVIGASGYSGAELISLLLAHPNVTIVGLFGSGKSEKVGAAPPPYSSTFGRFRGVLDMPVQATDVDAIAALRPDAVFLCTPHEASLDLAPQLRARRITVLDLSAAYRLQDTGAFTKFYALELKDTSLLRACGLRPARTLPRRHQDGGPDRRPGLLPHERHPAPSPAPMQSGAKATNPAASSSTPPAASPARAAPQHNATSSAKSASRPTASSSTATSPRSTPTPTRPRSSRPTWAPTTGASSPPSTSNSPKAGPNPACVTRSPPHTQASPSSASATQACGPASRTCVAPTSATSPWQPIDSGHLILRAPSTTS